MPPGNDSVSLRSRLGQETASHVRAEFESSWDSDDLDIDALSLGWQQRFGAGRWLDVSARGARIDQDGDQIDGRQLLIKGGTRLGSVEQGLFWPALTVGVRDYDGWQTAAWKLQGTLAAGRFLAHRPGSRQRRRRNHRSPAERSDAESRWPPAPTGVSRRAGAPRWAAPYCASTTTTSARA